jgi:hypothetical protein
MQVPVRSRTSFTAWTGLALLFAACATSGGDAVDVSAADSHALTDVAMGDDASTGDLGEPDVASDATAETTADTTQEVSGPSYLDLPVGACGMPGYELIDPAELGEVLAWEAMPLWDAPAATLNAILAGTDYGDLQVPYGAKVYRMRYTTQDRGQLVEATAVVAVPKGDDLPDGPLPIILHTHGTTGFVDECAPSHPDNAPTLSAVAALMSAMGYVFVGPDFIGMNGFGGPASVQHAYLVGEQIAVGSWDAVRAARRALAGAVDPAVPTAARVIPWGESQGGHGALFAEQYAPYYAPEFEVPAVVALVGPVNLLSVLQHATAKLGPGSGVAMMSLVAMYAWYGHQGSLDDILTNDDPIFLADHVLAAMYPEEQCSVDEVPQVDTIDQIFDAEALTSIAAGDWGSLAPWSCYYAENSLPTTSVAPLRFVPTLMVYGEADVLMPLEAGREGFRELCDLGWQLEHVECAAATHVDAALLSLTRQFDWVAARLAGEPIDPDRLCELQAPTSCSLGD